MSAARGAISLPAKSCTVSRIASAVSPRSKLNIRCALGIMVVASGDLTQVRTAITRGEALVTKNDMVPYHDGKQLFAVRPKAPNSPLRARSPRGVIPANKVALRTQSGRARREPLMDGTIDLDTRSSQDAARERAYALPLSEFDPGHPELFRSDTPWPYFDRLRKEDPVHYCKESMFGPYLAVTRYNDIMAIDTNHQVFSSAA